MPVAVLSTPAPRFQGAVNRGAADVLDVFIAQQRLISNKHQRPGVDTGDSSARATSAGRRCSMPSALRSGTSLNAASLAGHIGVRGIYQPPWISRPRHGNHPRTPRPHRALPPVMAPLLLGESLGPQFARCCSPQAASLSCLGLSLLLVGPGLLAPVGIGARGAVHSWARRWLLALQAQRVLVISPGDST